MGLYYNSGPYQERTGIPASAFSAGDLLMYTSASSLSRIPATFESGDDICGVAISDSNKSLNNQVPYVVANPNTVFWSHCTTGSQYTSGEELDFQYSQPTGFMVGSPSSVTTARLVIWDGSKEVNDSGVSRVRVTLIGHSSLLEHT